MPAFTLDQLRVLDAIDRTGSFAGAGRHLRRATSAVSYAIRGLEDAIGQPLYDRSGHRAQLTAAGEQVLGIGREVLAQASELTALSDRLASGWEAEISIVVDGLAPTTPVMRAVRQLSATGAPTQVNLRVEFLSGVTHRFFRDGVDVMLTLDWAGMAHHKNRPDLVATRLPDLEVVLVGRYDHPVFDVAGPLSRDALARHVELFVADSGPGLRATASRSLGLGCPQVVRLPDFHAKHEALLTGVGIGWLPRHLARAPLARGSLRLVDFDEGDTHIFQPYLVQRRGRAGGRANQLIAQQIIREMRELGPGADSEF